MAGLAANDSDTKIVMSCIRLKLDASTVEYIMEKTGLNKGRVLKALEDLISSGQIVNAGKGYKPQS